MKTKSTKPKDIFNGNILYVWEDEDLVFLSFPFATLIFVKEDWKEIKEDFKALADL